MTDLEEWGRVLSQVVTPHKVCAHIAEYDNNRPPVGKPDRSREYCQWYDGDGKPIDDPERIAQLEDQVAKDLAHAQG